MEKEKVIYRIIERGSIVEIKGRDCCFVVIGIGNKFHNKWFHISPSQEGPVWPSQKKNQSKLFKIHLREIAQDKRTGAACFKGYGELRDMGVEKKENQAYVAIHNINDIEKVHENKMDIDGLGF